jgi:hypothetical protein
MHLREASFKIFNLAAFGCMLSTPSMIFLQKSKNYDILALHKLVIGWDFLVRKALGEKSHCKSQAHLSCVIYIHNTEEGI